MSKSSSLLAGILLLSIVIVAGGHGHIWQAILTIILLLWLCLSGLPLSRALLQVEKGSDQPQREEAALLFALPLGYVLHSVLLSLLSFAISIHSITFVVYLAVVSAVFLIGRPGLGKLRLSPNVVIWQLLVVAATGWILYRVGTETPDGFAYRAYFNADFFKHLGITGTLLQTHVPPLNPYLSGYVLHYYWFFYIIPAYFSTLIPSFPAESLLIEFTLFGSLAFVGCLYATIRLFTQSKSVLPFAFTLLLLGGSYEGLYGIHHLHTQGKSWKAFTTLNIDGLTRWIWQTPQVDTLFRALLYAPQHLLALCIVLLWLIARKNKITTANLLAFYSAVFATLGFAAIIGVVFIFTALLFLGIEFLKDPKDKIREALPVLVLGGVFLLLYFPILQMFTTHEASLSFGLVAPIWGHLPGYLILNWGALLIFGVAGLIRGKSEVPRGILCFFLCISLFCMHYIKDTVGGSEVTLKLGYLVDLSFLLLSAAFFEWFLKVLSGPGSGGLKFLIPIAALFILPASVTTLIDFYNTQDVMNSQFTSYIPKSDRSALEWIAENLPSKTVVQHYGLEGQNVRVSFIPPFAQRMIYLGDPFHSRAFQVPFLEVDRRENTVWSLFHTNKPQIASSIAQKGGIEYLFLGTDESTTIPDFRYQLQSPYFSIVFQEDQTLVARVNHMNIPQAELKEENFQIILRNDSGEPQLRADFGNNFYDAEGNIGSRLGRWMRQDGELKLTGPSALEGLLQMTVQSLGKGRHIRISKSNEVIFEGDISARRTFLSFPLHLASGENRLLIHAEEGPETADRYAHNGDQRLVSIRITDLKFVPAATDTH